MMLIKLIYNFIRYKICISRLESLPQNNKINKFIIFGNGPSLSEIVINSFDSRKNNDFLVVVNDFVNSDYYTSVKPDFYVIVDPFYCNEELNMPIIDINNREIFFNNLIHKTTWRINIICPLYSYSFIKNRLKINKFINVVSYNHNLVSFRSYKLFSYNFGTPLLQNVINAAIFIGINLKSSEIHLFGVDHSWLNSIAVNNENRLVIINNLFFGYASFSYFNKGGSEQPYKYHEILTDYAKMFKTYHILQGYANFMKVKIINNCKDSYIDAFEKS